MIDDKLLFDVAVDYYINKKLQKEIAKELGVSRVQVSKYLKLASERGIVKIEITPPEISNENQKKYQELFNNIFGLNKLLLAPSYSNPERLLYSMCQVAGEYISSQIPNEPYNVGIGWGNTMTKLALTYDFSLKNEWNVVPLSGGISKISDERFNINYIVQSFAKNLNSKFTLIYLPFILEKGIKENITSSSEYKKIVNFWEKLDVVIASVGYSISRSPLFRQNVIEGKYINQLEQLNIVGDILTHYFDIQGNVYDLEFIEDIINISINQYKKAKLKIVVAGGLHKVESIIGLLRGKLVDVLITDQKTAENVLNYVYEEGEDSY
ncbi:sugar-binding transcriptional regulator [Petrotoga halophila]|uniref:Transcriptional regulator n=1 Tax=Petrotoga halophila DSM 16923 TaxID=1122953 RepID=A0A2S5EH87_9BACT|nr:sugar-binding domain-containing protein [Petrotoga halophila]POZ92349.1 transcriptional regulator [Petrotoga halophila DSM 16923]